MVWFCALLSVVIVRGRCVMHSTYSAVGGWWVCVWRRRNENLGFLRCIIYGRSMSEFSRLQTYQEARHCMRKKHSVSAVRATLLRKVCVIARAITSLS